jgi:molybdopterin-guanine dinucleotide biosynthesis protein A
MNQSNKPLHGLVLAGGRSSRMRSDKAALDNANTPQDWQAASRS